MMAANHVAIAIADDIDARLTEVAEGGTTPAGFIDSMADLVATIRKLDAEWEAK